MIFEDNKLFLDAIPSSKLMKLMSIDIGAKKLGLAISHSSPNVVIPYRVLIRKNLSCDIEILRREVVENSICGIVLGLPIDVSGQSGDNVESVKKFAQKLSKLIEIPITFYDERFTTRLADRMLSELHINRKERNKIDDKISAAIILEDFLKRNMLW